MPMPPPLLLDQLLFIYHTEGWDQHMYLVPGTGVPPGVVFSHYKFPFPPTDGVDGQAQTPRFVRDTSRYWYKPHISREEGKPKQGKTLLQTYITFQLYKVKGTKPISWS